MPAYARPENGVPLPLWSDTPPDWRPRDDRSPWRPTLTPFLAPAPSKGLVIVCPGGGYGGRAAHEADPVARAFNRLGFSAVVLAYRTTAECHGPLLRGPFRDAARAVRVVRAHADAWATTPDRVAILGFSAGGHLAGTLAVHHARADDDAARDGFARVASRPDAALPCYAVLRADGLWAHKGSIGNLVGGEPAPDPDWRDACDLPRHVDAATAPCFLWHTAEDNVVPVENSLDMAAALRARGVPFALHVFSRGPHGVGLWEENPEVRAWPELAARWLEGTAFAGRAVSC